jgi:hypothetical protein
MRDANGRVVDAFRLSLRGDRWALSFDLPDASSPFLALTSRQGDEAGSVAALQPIHKEIAFTTTTH